jgi:hypothetical protein
MSSSDEVWRVWSLVDGVDSRGAKRWRGVRVCTKRNFPVMDFSVITPNVEVESRLYSFLYSMVRVRASIRPKREPAQPEGQNGTGKY